MAQNTESGHEKNVANFDVIIDSVLGIGKDYNPAKAVLTIQFMKGLAVNCKDAINEVRKTLSAYKSRVDEREAAFEKLPKLITRVSNALKVSDATPEAITTAREMLRKLTGGRAKAKNKEIPEAGSIPKTISVSQMGYDNQIGNLSQVVNYLSTISYKPNEKDLQVEGLTALLEDLKKKNAAVVSTATALFNARARRDELMYKEGGLVSVAQDAKAYIKSAFGTGSAHFRKVSSIAFRKN